MKAIRLVCGLRGHRWRRYRREHEEIRECTRCGHVVRADADPPRMFLPG